MSREPTLRALTPSQTVGPFFHDCLLGAGASCNALAGDDADGQRIEIHGYVLDGDGVGVPDAVLELWQADGNGVYHHAADERWSGGSEFRGFGRVGTDEQGRFEFSSIVPGRVADHHAPHICVAVFARGLLNHLFTRMYFPDESSNETDATLLCVPPERRGTLIARAVPSAPAAARSYRFDIVLQGRDETAFFAIA